MKEAEIMDVDYRVYPGLGYKIYDTKTAMKAITKIFSVTSKELLSPSRKRPIVEARQAYCYITSKKLKYTLDVVGTTINRDHATVIHSCKVIDILIEQDVNIARKIRILNSGIDTEKIKTKKYLKEQKDKAKYKR